MSMGTPRGISAARLKGFTSENVARILYIYEYELRNVKFDILLTVYHYVSQ
jgi:hypothetical protein